LWYALGTHPYRKIKIPNKGWIVSLDYPQSRDVIQPVIFELLPAHEMLGGSISGGWNKQDQILRLKNGSIIGFKSCESGREKFQGADKDWIWFDEEPPEDVYKECIARIPGGNRTLTIWGTLTPLKGFTWVYSQVYKSDRPDVECFEATIFDNKYLPEEEVIAFEASLNEYEKEARIYGRFGIIAGIPVFSPEAIKDYMEKVEQPREKGYFKKGSIGEAIFVKDKFGQVEIFDYPKNLHRYVIGADPSEGVRDRNVASVLSRNEFKQVAKIRVLSKPDQFAEQLELLGLFYNKALLGVESNLSGGTVLGILKKAKYPRLYYQRSIGKRVEKEYQTIGWRTTSKSKPIMIDDLEIVIRERELILPSKETVEELATYIRLEDNPHHTQAQAGCWDDEAIALAIAYQMYKVQPNYLQMIPQEDNRPRNIWTGM